MIDTESSRVLPAGARRVIFYLLFDPRGHVSDYIPYKLERLRPFAEKIIVVSNGPIGDDGRDRLAGVADEVWQRDNVGYDVGGYRWALAKFGQENLEQYDELILMNYTWFGPVGSFAPVFERMNALDIDYWGMTDHGETTPHPITLRGTMPAHIQSHWIAVRKSMFGSVDWKNYWEQMPPIESYDDSILLHESRFTSEFESLGYRYQVAFPATDFPGTDHPAVERVQELLDAGCPVLKRRIFFHDPLYLDREGVIGRWLLDSAESYGYPTDLILSNMSRNAQPRVLNTNASLFEILPEQQIGYDAAAPLRVVAIAHIFYEDMTDELLDRLAFLPGVYDLVVTTTDDAKASFIRERISERADPALAAVDVRIVPSNRGRDISAFYITCRDVLLDDSYDLVVKIHSKKTVQDGPTIGRLFKRQQIENLLNSPGYAANVVGLFQQHRGLGLVFAPMIHIGHPTLGGAWFTNKKLAASVCKEQGIHVPLDDISPLAPFGSMFIARPEALRQLLTREYTFEDFSEEGDYSDGTLAHVIERLPAYAAGERGFHTRTVANAEYAAISHTFLEYKLDQLSVEVQGALVDEIQQHQLRNRRARQVQNSRFPRAQAAYLFLRYPRMTQRFAPFLLWVREKRGPTDTH